MSGDGLGQNGSADKTLGEIVSEVSEKASLLVREEIELAKAEITGKLSKLTKGAVVAGAAGVFLIFGDHHALPHARLAAQRPLQLGPLDRVPGRHGGAVPARRAGRRSSRCGCSRRARRPRPTSRSRRPS